MTYELWETATGNIVGAYATQARALEVVVRSMRAYGEGYVDSWLLAFEDEGGEGCTIAEGSELAALALRSKQAARQHTVSA